MNKKQNYLVDGIAFFLILLFLYTGCSKLIDVKMFRDQMKASPLLGSVSTSVSWLLPILEFTVAVLLFIRRSRLKGLYASLVLMCLFTIYLIAILAMDNQLSCSCGGIIEELSPKQHLIFNIACVGLTIVAIIEGKNKIYALQSHKMNLIIATVMIFLIGGTILAAKRAKGPVKTGMEGRLLPSFNLLLPDSITKLNTKDIPLGKPFIMVGFSPFCIHCQEETREIIRNIDQFKDTQIYFVTTLAFKDMKRYYDAFHLAKYNNIIMGVDEKSYFLAYFKATSIPYTALFDIKKRLKEVTPGEVNIVQITQRLYD